MTRSRRSFRLPFHSSFIAQHRRRLPFRILADASRKYLDAWHNQSFRIATNGELRVLERLAPFTPRVVLDVGANVGEYAALARRVLPDAHLHCFEAAPPTFEKLRQSMRDDPAATLNPFGLSDQTGDARLHFYPGALGHSSLVDYPHGAPRVALTVRVQTGDAYLDDRGLQTVDFLKIDVEGWEGAVLRGFDRSLRSGRIRALQFEYGRANIITRELLRDLHQYLEPRGYVLGKIYPGYTDFRPYELADEDFRGANYLAVRRELAAIREALAR